MNTFTDAHQNLAEDTVHPPRSGATGRRKTLRSWALGLLALVGTALPAAGAWAALGASVTLYSGDPTTISPSQTTRLQITLSNSDTASAITGVGFSNSLPGTLPNGLKISGAATYACTNPATGVTADPGTQTLVATLGTQAISLSGGSIPARANNTDGTCVITIPVTAGTSSGSTATYTYTIASGAVTGNAGAVANSGTVNQSINVAALAKPTITKSFKTGGVTTVNPILTLGGSATTLSIAIANTNSVDITNFSVTDVFPQMALNGSGASTGLIKVAATPNASATNCGSPTFSPSAGDTSLTLTGGTIPASGTCTLTVDVEANHTGSYYQTPDQTNTISASSQFSNDIGIAAAADASALFRVRSPLAVTKTVSSSSLASGASGYFTITLTNNGASDLNGVDFTDTPIDGLVGGTGGLAVTGVSASNCGSPSLSWDSEGITSFSGGTVPAGASCSVRIDFTGTVRTANSPAGYTNSLAAGAVTVSGNSAIKSQAASAALTVADTLRATKGAPTPANPAPGGAVKYLITVQNWSSSALNNVAVKESLTGGQSYLTGTINGVDYTPTVTGSGCGALTVDQGSLGSTAPIFVLNTVPARSSDTTPGACTIAFWVKVPTTGGATYSNQLGTNSVCYNYGASETCSPAASNSVGGTAYTALLAASKSFSPAGPLNEGGVTRVTVTISNYSARTQAVAIADNLPAASSGGQMRVATPANAATTCSGSPVITANANSTSVEMTGATLPAGSGTGSSPGSCQLQFDVVGAAGVYNNTATVTSTPIYSDGNAGTLLTLSPEASFTFTASLSASKSFLPTSVASGGRSTVTVRLANVSNVALTNVSLTDPLPTGMTVANPANAYSSCGGSTSISATPGASSASLSGATINGSGSCDFIFDVTATGSGNWVNTIPINGISADGGIKNQTAVTATLTNTAATGLTVAKTTNPSTLTFPGQVSQLTITLTNGGQAVTNLRFTDYFTVDGTVGAAANGMAIAPTPAAATTCPGGVVSASAGGTSVGLSGVSLAANASCTVSVNVTSTTLGGITNYIPVGSIVTDQGFTNPGQASTSLTTQSNIGIVKQFTPNVVQPGERSRLRITFYNPTSQPMSAVGVTDTLPSGVTVPSGANPSTTCTGATVTSPTSSQVQIAGGSLPAASGGGLTSCYAEIDVYVAAQGDYVNTIPASTVTANAGGASVTNSQPTSDTLRAKTPVTIHKAIAANTLDSGNPVGFTTGTASRTPGSAATMTIRLDNPNNAALTAAAFTDSLPSGLVVATTPNAATTCSGGSVFASASATSVRLSGATIPANGYCTVTVDVLSNISGTYTNTIAAGAVTTYEGVSNAEPTSARLLVTTPPTVSKQFTPAVIPASGTSVLTIFLSNDNASAITLSANFTDTLPTAPGNIVVASAPNYSASTTCTGTLSATAGAGSISLLSGATIPVGGCTITVNVTGTTAGSHNNNIPAGALQTSAGNNQTAANATLLISPLGYVSGKVFKDNNLSPNGTFETGTDTGISGVSIQLYSGASCSGTLVSTTTTDALGNYLFYGLAAGTYSVCEPTQPTGTVNGTTTAGTITANNGSTGTQGAASNPSASTSQVVGIVLNGNGGSSEVSGSPGNNFAEVAQSTISGTVFLDQNNNGVQNGADTGIASVTLQLRSGANCSGTLVATTTTNASGAYSFSGLNPGTYTVCEPTQPSGTANGITTAGSVTGGTAGTASGVTTLPSSIAGIVLPPNTTASGNNFAEIPNGRTVSGRVFLDYNNNGVLNSGTDHGIGSQTVTLTGNDINGNAVSLSTTTAADGTYSFTAVPEGSSYTLNQPNQPNGTTNGITTAGSTGGTASSPTATSSRIAGINLAGGNTVSGDNNFAEVPGNAPDLAIAKTHSPASFGEGSSMGYYTITPSNVGAVATSGTVTVVDTLPAGITATSASGTGWTCAIAGQTVTCTGTTVIAANGTGGVITLRTAVAAGLAGQILTNTAVISGGGEPAGFDGNNTATDPTPIATTASVQGTVWLDANHNRILDDGDSARRGGWIVELLLNGNLVATTTSRTQDVGSRPEERIGAYSFTGLAPGSGYQIRFREPTSGTLFGKPVPNEIAGSYTNGVVGANNPAGADNSDGTLNNMTLAAGSINEYQSLPLDPSGVVYNSVTRQPVAGAVITISGPAGFTAADALGGSLTQTTGSDGFYQFLLLSSAPAGTYTLTVTTYPSGYLPSPSAIIPGCTSALTVAATPDPALVQNSNQPPAQSVSTHNPASCPAASGGLAAGAGTTQYYYSFVLTPGTSANVVNNHIPLDQILDSAIVVTKTTPLINVAKGDLVPYTVTATNTLSATLPNIDVRDQMPPGFKYRSGSATLNGVRLEPTASGRDLTWANQTFTANEKKTYKLVLVVGSGVSEGEYVNKAWALNNLVNSTVSNIATASVRIVPDPTFDCSDIIGKVFDDKNANGYQDQGEPGIPNVRVATARGLLITSDADGRFHVACADIPQADRGSNFVMKLDERTLPSGYRITTENPRAVRTTRGKMVKLNFGATVHKVVRLELDGRAFAGEGDALQPAWDGKLQALVPQLAARPTVLRIAYRAQADEPPDLAERRLGAIAKQVKSLYGKENKDMPPLLVETEAFAAKGVRQ